MTSPHNTEGSAELSGAAGHTPGPWELTRAVEDGNGSYRQVTEFGYGGDIVARVCVAHSLNVSLNECGEANARLIKAAPDLLEVLKEIVELVDFERGAGKNKEDREAARRLLVLTRNVIAGVTGEAA